MTRMRWTMRKVVEQAIALYESEARDAAAEGFEQARQFWTSHAQTARIVLERDRKRARRRARAA